MINEEKKQLRKKLKNQLKLYIQESSTCKAQSRQASHHVCTSPQFKKAQVVMLFMSTANEIDTTDILNTCLKDKKAICLPRINGENLDFYYLNPTKQLDSQLETNSFGIREPLPHLQILDYKNMPLNTLVIMPGLAFTPQGKRLGYGKGFYDRFISKIYESNSSPHQPLALMGLCYEIQIVDDLPCEAHDILVTHLATEKRFICCY